MAKLTANVLLSHPDSGRVEFLAEGSTLPEWAVGLVGDHVLDEPAESPASADEVDPYKGKTKADLKAEIDARNAARDDDH